MDLSGSMHEQGNQDDDRDRYTEKNNSSERMRILLG